MEGVAGQMGEGVDRWLAVLSGLGLSHYVERIAEAALLHPATQLPWQLINLTGALSGPHEGTEGG